MLRSKGRSLSMGSADVASFANFPVHDDADDTADKGSENTPAAKHRLPENRRDDTADCHEDSQDEIHR